MARGLLSAMLMGLSPYGTCGQNESRLNRQVLAGDLTRLRVMLKFRFQHLSCFQLSFGKSLSTVHSSEQVDIL